MAQETNPTGLNEEAQRQLDALIKTIEESAGLSDLLDEDAAKEAGDTLQAAFESGKYPDLIDQINDGPEAFFNLVQADFFNRKEGGQQISEILNSYTSSLENTGSLPFLPKDGNQAQFQTAATGDKTALAIEDTPSDPPQPTEQQEIALLLEDIFGGTDFSDSNTDLDSGKLEVIMKATGFKEFLQTVAGHPELKAEFATLFTTLPSTDGKESFFDKIHKAVVADPAFFTKANKALAADNGYRLTISLLQEINNGNRQASALFNLIASDLNPDTVALASNPENLMLFGFFSILLKAFGAEGLINDLFPELEQISELAGNFSGAAQGVDEPDPQDTLDNPDPTAGQNQYLAGLSHGPKGMS